jgi:hypothetical protein
MTDIAPRQPKPLIRRALPPTRRSRGALRALVVALLLVALALAWAFLWALLWYGWHASVPLAGVT